MDTKPVFHGSDIEKICSYYNLKKKTSSNSVPMSILWDFPQKPAEPLQNTWISFPPTRTENTHPFGIRFPATAIFPLISSFRETAPAS